MVIGASRGLGRALLRGLEQDGRNVVGVARTAPDASRHWIQADLSRPREAAELIAEGAPSGLSTVIYNVGAWEQTAFSSAYDFAVSDEDEIESLISVNTTAAILVLRRLIPVILNNAQPRVILTGSTSGLARSGRPEVAFGASKFALNGIAAALREGYRDRRLAVTTLQLGYLNTDDDLHVPIDQATVRGDGRLIPVHDVVSVVRMILGLSPSSFVSEIIMPAVLDDRF
ncbi:SDR family NAD(P)-dependent oxidoreductase [Pseudoclavibacter endophyticus]|nr:SDR family oxidoreductase [Pseudoclavibacter endophyticus]